MAVRPILDIRELSFNYPDGRRALHQINLQVTEGEKIGLVGSNGAGKSTLLFHLNGTLTGEGTISVDDRTLSPRMLGEIRRDVGLVFQDPDDQLFSPTVYEDVAFGPLYMGLPDAEVHDRVVSALDAVGMGHVADRVPHKMSLGEKKLVAIACVLSMSPRILALDEPTAGLDARARRRIIALLSGLRQTVLVATHDLDLVRRILPRTAILDEGRIVADGPTRELLADQEILERHGLI